MSLSECDNILGHKCLLDEFMRRLYREITMTDNLPEKQHAMELAADTAVFSGYLQDFGLPTDNIIATTEERRVLSANLLHFLDSLPPEEKRSAHYLSKFVGATAIGLFDAAPNYYMERSGPQPPEESRHIRDRHFLQCSG
jgi:hypothetical protein